MSTIGLTLGQRHATAQPARTRTRITRALLACGAISSLLYLATDVLGGLRHPGYSFTSQAVSELMAVGAPSEAFVDPLFLLYGALVVAFGVGLVREARGRNRALLITGALLIVYSLVGFAGPTLFEMSPRGSGTPTGDVPHIVLTALLVVLTLLAVVVGAFALGRRFRIYSFATLAIMIALGMLSGEYGARLAAGEPTPGFGIVERVMIYSSLLWVAVLGVALLRRPAERPEGQVP